MPMHPCPCCGYRTLPGRGDYDLCPVCWWEDEGLQPWEHSGPNSETLVEAQQRFLAQRRPYWLRPGKVRAPRRHEARDPGWEPFALTDGLMARVRRTHEEQRRHWDEESRRMAQEIADDPEGPFKEYNAAHRALKAEAAYLSHDEVKQRLGALSQEHGLACSAAHLELFARLMKDAGYYRRHPLRVAGWLLRYARPRTFRRHWEEVRTGRVSFAG